MSEKDFAQRYGPWALIAGASKGIGAALSHDAARRGLNVLMLARGQEELEKTAAEVAAEHGVETRALAVDLGDPEIGRIVAEASDGLEIGLLVYNAAIGPNNRFVDGDLDLHLKAIDVNARTPVILCHQLAKPMVERGRGGIVMISSMGGMQGAVNFSTYNATKAFEWILTETLWTELGDHGVDAVNVFVGATMGANYGAFMDSLDPELCNKVDSDDPVDRARSRLTRPSSPEEVAIASYEGLGKGPVAYTHPTDEWVANKCLSLPRDEATLVWRAVQETSVRRPVKEAK